MLLQTNLSISLEGWCQLAFQHETSRHILKWKLNSVLILNYSSSVIQIYPTSWGCTKKVSKHSSYKWNSPLQESTSRSSNTSQWTITTRYKGSNIWVLFTRITGNATILLLLFHNSKSKVKYLIWLLLHHSHHLSRAKTSESEFRTGS